MRLSRYFRFRLRTLLVFVTSAALTFSWVGYQLSWIRERHNARHARLSLSKMGFDDNAPWQLRWLGEDGLPSARAHEPEAARLRALFPEAEIHTVDW